MLKNKCKYKKVDKFIYGELKEILLLEFAGLFNGPEGRLKQALKDDKVIKTALDMLSDKKIYQASLSPKEIIEN